MFVGKVGDADDVEAWGRCSLAICRLLNGRHLDARIEYEDGSLGNSSGGWWWSNDCNEMPAARSSHSLFRTRWDSIWFADAAAIPIFSSSFQSPSADQHCNRLMSSQEEQEPPAQHRPARSDEEGDADDDDDHSDFADANTHSELEVDKLEATTIDLGASEPIPMDNKAGADQLGNTSREQEGPAQDREDEASKGAWSVSMTPMHEEIGFDIGDAPDPVAPAHSRKHGHSRVDSVPPQRFADDGGQEEEEEEDISASRRDAYLRSLHHTTHRPSLAPSMEEELDLDAQRNSLEAVAADLDSHLSEFEKAGLDFVDVQLGAGGSDPHDGGLSIYGPGSAAAKSRSSLEIRSDSISSSQNTGRQRSTDSARTSTLRFWQKRRDTETLAPEEAHSRPSAESTSSAHRRHSDLEESQVPELELSRAGPAAADLLNGHPAEHTHIQMLVADANGDVQAAEAQDDHAKGMAVADGPQEPPAEPSHIQPPAPKANTNESTVALDVKAKEANAKHAELSANQSGPSQSNGSIKVSGGRSAGPSQPGPSGEDRVDVRVDSSSATSSTPTQAGRSAGPVLGDASQPQNNAKGSTVSTNGTSSAGRSAGPILSESASTTSPSTPQSRRLSSNAGPSALERYMSRTRQSTLPPKTPKEDQRHLQDFEAMMRSSQALEAKRAKEEAEKQRRREEELAASTKIWEEEILKGDWRVARAKGSRLRAVWWQGAPPSLRGRAWQLAIGNGRMLPRSLCTTTKARVKEMKTKGEWPPSRPDAALEDGDVLEALEEDIERTLPSLKLFQKESGVLHDDLKETLECLVLLRADQAEEIRQDRQRSATTQQTLPQQHHKPRLYEPGLSLLVATLLLNVSQSETLLCVLNLLYSRPWLRSLYSMNPLESGQAPAFERVLNTLLADQQPKVYANLQAKGVDPSSYAREWVKTLFVPLLPFDLVCRLWDNLLLEEGDGTDEMVFRTCLALVGLLSSRLHVPDGRELISVLQGRNRAALSVWYRMIASGGVLAGSGAGRPGVAGASGSGGASSSSASAAIASLPPDSPLKAMASGAAPPPSQGRSSTSRTDSAVADDSDHDDEKGITPSLSSTPRKPSLSQSLNSNAGGGDSVEAPTSWVPRDALFSIYSIDEEALFSALEEQTDGVRSAHLAASSLSSSQTMSSPTTPRSSSASGGGSVPRSGGDGWWKESTLRRLIDRELGG